MTWDHRGHGESDPVTRDDATIENLARDWSDLIDTLAPTGPLLLAGHSIGGMTLMELCAKRPDLFERVVGAAFVSTSSGQLDTVTLGLPDTGPLLRAQIPRMLALRSRTLSRRARRRAPIVERLLMRRLVFGRPLRLADAALAVDGLISSPGHTVVGFYNDFMGHDRAEALKVLDDIPTHVLVGTRDVLTPPSHALRIADHVQGSVLTIVPDAGHMLPLERDQLVSGVLIRLIRPHLVTERLVLRGGARSPPGRAPGSAPRSTRCSCPSHGIPILARSVRTVLDVVGVHRIVLVVRPEDRDAVCEAVGPHLGAHDLWVVDGGEHRHDSEWQALRILAGGDRELRDRRGRDPRRAPGRWPPAALWRDGHRCRRGARWRDPRRTDGTALPARRDARSAGLVGVQTPQAFRAGELLERLPPGRAMTGSSAPTPLRAWSGTPTSSSAGVPSTAANLKVTFPEDIALAEALLLSSLELSATSTSRSPSSMIRCPSGGACRWRTGKRLASCSTKPGRSSVSSSSSAATTVAGSTTGEVTQTSGPRGQGGTDAARRRTP